MSTFEPRTDSDPRVVRLGRVNVAVVGDALDRLGLRVQVL